MNRSPLTALARAMSMRFKFRSSLIYESLDIGKGDSITAADLKSKIRRHRNVNVSYADCDLVISDALTGLQYRDDHVEIRSGSSVVIKRVPTGAIPTAINSGDAIQAIENQDMSRDTNKRKKSLVQWCFSEHAQPSLDCDVNASDPLLPSHRGIRLELINNLQCPSCSSAKCRVEDLLPNISLRHAVEHFLESKAIYDGIEDCPHQQPSDGESGNNAKEDSGEVTILKRDKLVRTSAIHEIVGDTAECLEFRTNIFTPGTLEDKNPLFKEIHVNEEEVGSSCPRGTEVVYPDFQEESESFQKQGGEVCSLEAERINVIQGVRGCYMCESWDHLIKGCPVAHAHGSRACYICGSFDHLMRDCHEVSIQHPMPGRGEIFPFWNASPMGYARSSGYQFCGSMVSAFNSVMVPGASFSIPSNMSVTYVSLPAYSGFMRYGWTPYASGMAANQYLTSQRLTDFQKSRVSGDNMRRDSYIDVAANENTQNKSCDLDKEKSDNPGFRRKGCQSVSDRSFSPKPLENHQRGRVALNLQSVGLMRGLAGVITHLAAIGGRPVVVNCHFPMGKTPCSSSYLNKERCPHHPRASSKHEMKRGRSTDDELSRSRSQPDIRDLKRKRMELNHTRHSEKYPRSSDRGIHRHGEEVELDKNCSRSSRNSKDRQASRHEEKNMHDGWAHERWKMTSRSNEDSPGRHHHHKSNKKLGKKSHA